MLPISSWLFHRHKQLDLEVLEMTDIGENWLLGLHDIEVHFTYDKELHVGRGQAFDRDLALEKACAEALERLGFVDWGRRTSRPLTSSGFAAHRTRALASTKAKSELIERDLLMCSMLSGAKFWDVDPTELKKVGARFKNLRKRLEKAGIQLRTAELSSDFNERVFLSAAFGRHHRIPFGCNIGMGISKAPSEAIEKSIQECLMMISMNLAGVRMPNLSLQKFNRLAKAEFVEHTHLGFNLKYAKNFERRFESRAAESLKTRSADPSARSTAPQRLMPVRETLYDSFTLEPIELPNFFKSCPIKIVRAENKKLQRIILGVPDEKTINKTRLRQFEKSLSAKDKLKSFDSIHILG